MAEHAKHFNASHNQTKNAIHLKIGTDLREECANITKYKKKDHRKYDASEI